MALCTEMSFNSNAWGPIAWHHLHLLGFAFPAAPTQTDRDNFARFLDYFARTLPCSECRTNFSAYLNRRFKPDTHLKNCDTISRFLFEAHNHVNRKLGKPVLPSVKYDVVKKYYMSMRDPRVTSVVNLVANESKK